MRGPAFVVTKGQYQHWLNSTAPGELVESFNMYGYSVNYGPNNYYNKPITPPAAGA